MRRFCPLPVHRSDIYIADYTNQTSDKQSVVVSEFAFDDIQSCHIINNKNVGIASLIPEQKKSFFRDKKGHPVAQCDYIAISSDASSKGWLCFIEFKYCQENNVETNVPDAYGQISKTKQWLESLGVNMSEYRVYFNVSIPDHSNKEPFSAHRFTQNEIIDYKKNHKVHILGSNTITVLNEGYLHLPN